LFNPRAIGAVVSVWSGTGLPFTSICPASNVEWSSSVAFIFPALQAGNKRGYRPDFLVQKIDGTIELHEMKGGQFLDSPDTIRKHERARLWCKQRGMKFVVLTKK